MAYTLVASKLDRWWITAPMVFVAAGTILGPGVLNVLPFSPSNETILWSIFGGLFVGKLFTLELSAQPIIYAIVSLTLIRMVPVAIVLIGKHLRPATVAFMGWFGPRGLASVVFTLIALQELEHSGGGTLLVQTATWTILLSVVLHGISASPLAARYGAPIAKAGEVPELAIAEKAGRRSRPYPWPRPPACTRMTRCLAAPDGLVDVQVVLAGLGPGVVGAQAGGGELAEFARAGGP